MPVRLLNSRILKWPRKSEVIAALRAWIKRERTHHPELVRAGYFGSLADGRWGVGSDADLIAVVTHSARPQFERPLDWDLRGIPVDADLLVYTVGEWQSLRSRGDRFAREMERVIWF